MPVFLEFPVFRTGFMVVLNVCWIKILIGQSFLFLDSRTSRLQVPPGAETANRRMYFGSRLFNTTLIQEFTDIESVCERY